MEIFNILWKDEMGNSNYNAFPPHKLQVAFGNIVTPITLK